MRNLWTRALWGGVTGIACDGHYFGNRQKRRIGTTQPVGGLADLVSTGA